MAVKASGANVNLRLRGTAGDGETDINEEINGESTDANANVSLATLSTGAGFDTIDGGHKMSEFFGYSASIGEVFVIGGTNGYVWSSTSGWVRVVNATTAAPFAVHYHPAQAKYYGAFEYDWGSSGISNTIYSSTDLVNWTAESFSIPSGARGFGAGHYYNGTLYFGGGSNQSTNYIQQIDSNGNYGYNSVSSKYSPAGFNLIAFDQTGVYPHWYSSLGGTVRIPYSSLNGNGGGVSYSSTVLGGANRLRIGIPNITNNDAKYYSDYQSTNGLDYWTTTGILVTSQTYAGVNTLYGSYANNAWFFISSDNNAQLYRSTVANGSFSLVLTGDGTLSEVLYSITDSKYYTRSQYGTVYESTNGTSWSTSSLSISPTTNLAQYGNVGGNSKTYV